MESTGLRAALPEYLREWQEKIEGYARRSGLDFFPQIFEVLSFDEMNEVAAFGGFPTRYPHWRWGMDYERLKKSSEYGLSRIYEMVINNNPCVAYLLEGNSLTDQKLVMAHVCGHNDFFKNNYAFKVTDQDRRPPGRAEDMVVSRMDRLPTRKWIDTFANHASRVRRHMDRYGVSPVEEFIDVCHSLENLIDPPGRMLEGRPRAPEKDENAPAEEVPRLKSSGYMDSFINPKEYLDAQRAKMDAEAAQTKRFPEKPMRDVLWFLLENAPLERWERDVLEVIREEAYYFWPQAQTKVMNEGWACLHPDSLVFTAAGVVTMRELVEGASDTVFDGEAPRRVYDQNVIRDHETVTMRTRRGIELCGSVNHRVLLADGETWKRLDELAPGDRVQVSGGGGMWARDEVALSYTEARAVTLDDVAEEAGVSVWTVLRHRAGRVTRSGAAVAQALEATAYEETPWVLPARRKALKIPATLDARVGAILGYLVGDGHISRVKRHLGLTTGDLPQAVRFATLIHDAFGLEAQTHLDGNRYRVLVHAEALSDLMVESFGLTEGPSAARKRVPAKVMRSPAAVVQAFLRAYFDCDGYAGRQGVILSTASAEMSRQVQLLLLNFGVLSRRRAQKDGCWHVHVAGASAARFAEVVGFGLERKQAALEAYVSGHRWTKAERWDDEVVSLERGRSDVYDISVEDTHRYAAGGVVNHNSFWHSKIMTGFACDASEIIDYSDRNASVMGGGGKNLNPYKLGVELYRNIEERWNKGRFGKEWEDCTNLEDRLHWDRQLGLGRKKIFEVRALYTDVMFIDEFLTPEFVIENKLFTYAWSNRNDRFEIDTREFKAIKEKLLFQMTNFGNPFIFVEDGNYENRGELLLRHEHQGVDLDQEKGKETLKNLFRVWRRPCSLATQFDGRPTLLRFDGKEHTSKPVK
ncbi:MAG: SpoVR family protein [Deltaproteobacteria bacterium]|nr:SpoVR family protein [Myxococcales bacterium]MDP3221417.1 SpoVR family protein [Deltaproteobacteria bacterium]